MRLIRGLVPALLLISPPLHGQNATMVLGTTEATAAAANSYVFLLSERAFGSRCFGVSGQNNGVGMMVRAVSEGLNGYVASSCRHHGLSPQRLQNGWRVRRVATTESCQYKNGNTWTNLAGTQCTFSVRTRPVVGSDLAIFEADVLVRGSALQDRRATLTWRIELEGPAGTLPWALQAPGQPVLQSPQAQLRLTTGATEFVWTAPATGATDYRVVFCRASGACQEAARVTGTRSRSLTVPFRGERVTWHVRACNSRGCTNSADRRDILNLLPSAVLVSPGEGSTAADRRPTFQWRQVSGAQTYELYVYHPQPLQPFRIANLSSSVTSFRPATDLTLDSPVYWSVNACTTAAGCGSPTGSDQVRSLNLPPRVSFAAELAPTFRHERCRHCHAVAATNFQVNAGGLPAGHPAVNSSSNCVTCHTSSLLPAGAVDPGWHAPAGALDFRNRSDAQLCAMAKDRGTLAASAHQHLTQDRLILWAVGDGRVPGRTLATAPPHGIAPWRALVERWVAAGMPCD